MRIKNYIVGIITGASIVSLVVMTYIAWNSLVKIQTLEKTINNNGVILQQVVDFLNVKK